MAKSNQPKKGGNNSKNNNKSLPENTNPKINTDKESEGIDPEIFEELPPEIREVVRTGISMQRISGPLPNPLFSKINENHIDKILDLAEKEDTNSYNDAQSNKKYSLFYFLAFIGLFVFVTIYLAKTDKELFIDILKIIISIAGGFGGGYGYKSYIDSKKKE